MLNAVIFGAGSAGKNIYLNASKKYNILAFTDNDSRKWCRGGYGLNVISPNEAVSLKADMYIIATLPGLKAIKKQLLDAGISESQIDDSFVIAPLESRRIFLENLSVIMKEANEEGAVAEAGVFEGDFAEYINEYYPNKILHLFDTFNGFDERNIKAEKKFSSASTGDYSNTSIDMVMKKMKHPDMVVIHQGFFPDTSKDINERFCFVNLDLDLYEPTLAGLLFFENKMSKNGVILVHDYYATNFKGPKEAVKNFLKERPNTKIFPIGDGLSVMVLVEK